MSFAKPSTDRLGHKGLRRTAADAWGLGFGVLHTLQAHVTHMDGRRVQKLDLKTEEEAQALAKRIAAASLQVWHHRLAGYLPVLELLPPSQTHHHNKQEKRKAYVVRRHDGSLCTQKQPDTDLNTLCRCVIDSRYNQGVVALLLFQRGQQ